MIVFGILLIAGSGAIGAGLVLQNRGAATQVHAFGYVWTVHLYTVLIIGALLACWAMLGAALISCRVSERRQLRQLRHLRQARQARAASARHGHHSAAPAQTPAPRHSGLVGHRAD